MWARLSGSGRFKSSGDGEGLISSIILTLWKLCPSAFLCLVHSERRSLM
jgi:hypothetical protein